MTPASPFPVVPSTYRREYNTIEHNFLDAEIGAGDVTPQMYAILDDLIDEAVSKLRPMHENMPATKQRELATAALNSVDCILLRHGLVYPGRGLVQLLSDGLGPTLYDVPEELQRLKSQPHNLRRSRFIAAFGQGPYYVVDCDTASYIYLAIGEVLGYPIKLIEIPGHNFIRWQFTDGSYMNYETLDGMPTDDEYSESGWRIPPDFVHVGGILDSMTRSQELAYHALRWQSLGLGAAVYIG